MAAVQGVTPLDRRTCRILFKRARHGAGLS